MASSNVDICNILTENRVNSLLNTLVYGDRKFLVWTRLSLENRSWVFNASDGVNVWKVEMEKKHIDSYKELAQIETYEAFLIKIRSDFHLGHLMINPEASKLELMVGQSESVTRIDLYEAINEERKTELQHLILWMADNITSLTDKLKETTENLDRLKSQKEPLSSISGTFEIQPKAITANPAKRKSDYSLVNPESRNQSAILTSSTAPSVINGETTAHISVLSGSNILDVYRCPDPSRCHFPCFKSNRRYHCPLCDNKPQKPGRMRRHFFTMHAGRHAIEHEGYRILRCKLKCTRANGRITDSSHYHCCLCGRVCLRKVHLCCHLQAHALGTAKDVDDEMMDITKSEEEEEERDDEDEGEDNTVLQTPHLPCPTDDTAQNMVTLADGTQVVYMQSMESGETLTVVSSQSDTSLSTDSALGPNLHVLDSSQSNNDIELESIHNAVNTDGQDLETILNNEGGQELVSNEPNTNSNQVASSPLSRFEVTEASRQLSFEQSFNELSKEQQNSGDLQTEAYNQKTTANLPCELNTQDSLPLPHNIPDLVSTATESDVSQTSTSFLRSTVMASPLRNESNSQLAPVSCISKPSKLADGIVLLKGDRENQGDDTVFNKLFFNIKPRMDNIFRHASVIQDRTDLEISRCKNTECDCRLYHCPLCTCLPNKPGRIREHFRKIHAENLIIRFQGYQMLRCKLGCRRPTGKRVLNSHYHCCLCGWICISKSGVYEHMRTQHTDLTQKKDVKLSANGEKRTTNQTTSTQKQSDNPPNLKSNDEPQGPRTSLVVQIPSVPNSQTLRDQQVEISAMLNNQQTNDTTINQQQQQPLVIVMPQQIQNNTQGSNQQPIYIVMPQGGGGGSVQMTHPYIVPMPQAANN